TLFVNIAPLREWAVHFTICQTPVVFGAFDFVGGSILMVLVIIYLSNFVKDAKGYAEIDPVKAYNK
ncbi:MAG: hypothetical protein IKU98_01980, partial [Bacteroidaceae bacterium]|nr:hypothetical protein [Bacteroidaceae bacterium]